MLLFIKKMTYVEFFEKSSVVNVCSCLTNAPERVIFIGPDVKVMQKYMGYYRKIFSQRGYDIELICRGVNKNNLAKLVEAISEIVEGYEDVAFDLTGGEDLVLVAMGIVYEKYKGIQLHRFNVKNNTIYDCDSDGVTIEKEPIYLTVEEHVIAYGGEIVRENEKSNTTYDWEMSEDFTCDIEAMWRICKRNVRLWNSQTGVLALVEKLGVKNGLLCTRIKSSFAKERIKELGVNTVAVHNILQALANEGLVSYSYDENEFSIEYKNEQVRRCLIKSGQALEMKVFSMVNSITDENGKPYYNAKNGVFIDWDGYIHSSYDSVDTENEIDVIAMRGVVPVFISCKNGFVEMDELYKLNSVAYKFGGEYSKKVLVTTALNGSSVFGKHFKQRAEDMNIRIIDNFAELSDLEIKKIFKNLWR